MWQLEGPLTYRPQPEAVCTCLSVESIVIRGGLFSWIIKILLVPELGHNFMGDWFVALECKTIHYLNCDKFIDTHKFVLSK